VISRVALQKKEQEKHGKVRQSSLLMAYKTLIRAEIGIFEVTNPLSVGRKWKNKEDRTDDRRRSKGFSFVFLVIG